MFGYILANAEQLTDAQKLRYRSCYCGLCHAIGQRASNLCRLSLNYDMTFLVLLLSALYEPNEQAGQKRCAVHPIKSHAFWITDATRYCADMNVALSYYNCMDDWCDDRNLIKRAEARIFAGPCRAGALDYPRQSRAFTDCLAELSRMERANDCRPDAAANCFGTLMGELFVWKETDYWSPALRRMGQALGRFIYILDAVCDLPSDTKKGRFNPLSALPRPDGPASYHDELVLLVSDATAEFEKLPLVQDAELLRNILYAGVWNKYLYAVKKHETQKTKESSHDF